MCNNKRAEQQEGVNSQATAHARTDLSQHFMVHPPPVSPRCILHLYRTQPTRGMVHLYVLLQLPDPCLVARIEEDIFQVATGCTSASWSLMMVLLLYSQPSTPVVTKPTIQSLVLHFPVNGQFLWPWRKRVNGWGLPSEEQWTPVLHLQQPQHKCV